MRRTTAGLEIFPEKIATSPIFQFSGQEFALFDPPLTEADGIEADVISLGQWIPAAAEKSANIEEYP